MRTIVLEVPDELADQLDRVYDRLPELLALSLRQPAVPADIYRAILTFLAGAPTHSQIAAFRPTPEMQDRLDTLLERSIAGSISSVEQAVIILPDRAALWAGIAVSGAPEWLARRHRRD